MPTVLILGANGRLGRVLVDAFHAAGWQVLAHARRALASPAPAGVRTLNHPLTDLAGLAAASGEVQVVVHAMNPPYPRWATEALALTHAAMNLALRIGATLMLPGNVYNYGSPMPALLTESTPQTPSSRKGALRVEMETALRERSALASIVIRAGDFFGGPGHGAWFDEVIVKPVAHGRLVYPGPLEVEHAWAYLPDLAQTFVHVAARRDSLDRHTSLHFPGHTMTGTRLAEAVTDSALNLGVLRAGQRLRIAPLPWGWLRLGGLVVPMWRELAELRYLWNETHRLDGHALTQLIGTLPATPLGPAVETALAAQLSHNAHGVHAP